MNKSIIEKQIPIPPVGYEPIKYETKYPFRDMKVGDSIFIQSAKKTISHARYWEAVTNFKFTQRRLKGGIRIWRIK